jgi:hypothetical protein
MARRERQEDRVKRWQERITAANKVYDAWATKYKVKKLLAYYCGQQSDEDDTYILNLIFPTIETNQPSLLFNRPHVKVEPKPPYADDPESSVAMRATLCADTVQSFIDKAEVGFKIQTLLALRDANFQFGVIETGYSADWIDNPHAGKPVLKENNDPMLDSEGNALVQPEQLPQSEALYVKAIPPSSVRVSHLGKNVLTDNDWVGYFEWAYLEDVKRNPKYRHTSDLKASGQDKDLPSGSAQDEDRERRVGMVKLWKIWDLRVKVKHVLADGYTKYLVEGEPWTYLPLSVLKFYEIPREFYPLPPVFNWLSPQDEYNESRQQQKVHRQRFNRHYTVHQGGIDQDELEKVTRGPDGSWAWRNTPDDPIIPVQDAKQDGAAWNNLAVTKDDFQQITGVSGDQRGSAESETATQANIIDVRSRIRESAQRVVVADWLSDICLKMLLCLREKMQLPFWIQTNVDLQGPMAEPEALRVAAIWQEITAKELGTTDLDVSVDITSLSPVSEDQKRQEWLTGVLPLITNPTMAMVFSLSDVLMRKTLGFFGIKSEADIKEIQKVMQAIALMSAQSAAGAETPEKQPGQPAGQPTMGGMGVQ